MQWIELLQPICAKESLRCSEAAVGRAQEEVPSQPVFSDFGDRNGRHHLHNRILAGELKGTRQLRVACIGLSSVQHTSISSLAVAAWSSIVVGHDALLVFENVAACRISMVARSDDK